jgi:pimeloyl-ACP methyl ester carboxylesterase
MTTPDAPTGPEGSGERFTIEAAGIPWSAIAWGDTEARPLLLIHGVTASAAIWWRVGPRLAATGRRVVAVDLPGHGRTGHWSGRHRWAETAEDVVAFARAAGLDRPDLQVVAHSWGAQVAANLPAAGLRPATIVLLDPPALPVSLIAQMASDPTWRTYEDPAESVAAIAAANPTWVAGDVEAAAEAMRQVDVAAARAIVLDNGDWDAGLAALADPAAADSAIWLVRGEPATGGLTMDPAAAEYARRYGEDHVITIPGAPHSPQRTDLEATVGAFGRALDG